MSQLETAKRFAATLANVGWRRLRGEPRSEHWPVKFEVLRDFIRENFEAIADSSPQEVRAHHEEMAANRPYDRTAERQSTRLGGVDVEWFRPADGPKSGGRLVVYVPGGGYLYGSTNTHADTLGRLVEQSGMPLVGINYRHLPEHTLEEARADVVNVWEALIEEGWEPSQMVMAGDSAGGGLLVNALRSLRDSGRPMPAKIALISPWIDLHCDAPSYAENDDLDYLSAEMFRRTAEIVRGGRPADDPIVSPIYAELHDLPPVLVHHGEGELMADDCRDFVARLEEAGVEVESKSWPDMVHAFHAFGAALPQARLAIGEIADFLAG